MRSKQTPYKNENTPFECSEKTGYNIHNFNNNYKITNSDGSITYLKGIVASEEWQPIQPHNFKCNGIKTEVTYPNYAPTFNNTRMKEFGPGTYYIKIENNAFIVKDNKSKELLKVPASNFENGVIPNRMIMFLQGGGGGGGGSSNVFLLTICSGGADGEGGGAGGFAALIIDTEILKESSNNYYEIKVGEGGKGAISDISDWGDQDWSYQTTLLIIGSGWANAGNGHNGKDTTLSFKPNGKSAYTLCTALGGCGGGGGDGWLHGTVGTGRGANINTNTDIQRVWPLNCIKTKNNENSDYYVSINPENKSLLEGGSCRGHEKQGATTPNCKLTITSDTSTTSTNMYVTIGGFTGGYGSENQSSYFASGGGSSYFGKGGNGGTAASGGSDGEKGAGGGGGAWTYGGIAIPIVSPAIILASLKAGGNGGDGFMRLYY